MSTRTQTQSVSLKRGDSFIFTGNSLLDNDGNKTPLTGWSIRSQIRSSDGSLIEELVVTIDTDTYSLYSTGTEDWPTSTLFWDVEYTTPDGVIFSTDTMAVKVTQDITY